MIEIPIDDEVFVITTGVMIEDNVIDIIKKKVMVILIL